MPETLVNEHEMMLGNLSCLHYQLATIEALLRHPRNDAQQQTFIKEKADWFVRTSFAVGLSAQQGAFESMIRSFGGVQ